MVSSVGIDIGDNTPKIQWDQLDPLFKKMSSQLCDCSELFKKCLAVELSGPMKDDLQEMQAALQTLY